MESFFDRINAAHLLVNNWKSTSERTRDTFKLSRNLVRGKFKFAEGKAKHPAILAEYFPNLRNSKGQEYFSRINKGYSYIVKNVTNKGLSYSDNFVNGNLISYSTGNNSERGKSFQSPVENLSRISQDLNNTRKHATSMPFTGSTYSSKPEKGDMAHRGIYNSVLYVGKPRPVDALVLTPFRKPVDLENYGAVPAQRPGFNQTSTRWPSRNMDFFRISNSVAHPTRKYRMPPTFAENDKSDSSYHSKILAAQPAVYTVITGNRLLSNPDSENASNKYYQKEQNYKRDVPILKSLITLNYPKNGFNSHLYQPGEAPVKLWAPKKEVHPQTGYNEVNRQSSSQNINPVTININKSLVENFTISTRDGSEAIGEFKRKVEEALLEILNSTNAIQ